ATADCYCRLSCQPGHIRDAWLPVRADYSSHKTVPKPGAQSGGLGQRTERAGAGIDLEDWQTSPVNALPMHSSARDCWGLFPPYHEVFCFAHDRFARSCKRAIPRQPLCLGQPVSDCRTGRIALVNWQVEAPGPCETT